MNEMVSQSCEMNIRQQPIKETNDTIQTKPDILVLKCIYYPV